MEMPEVATARVFKIEKWWNMVKTYGTTVKNGEFADSFYGEKLWHPAVSAEDLIPHLPGEGC